MCLADAAVAFDYRSPICSDMCVCVCKWPLLLFDFRFTSILFFNYPIECVDFSFLFLNRFEVKFWIVSHLLTKCVTIYFDGAQAHETLNAIRFHMKFFH